MKNPSRGRAPGLLTQVFRRAWRGSWSRPLKVDERSYDPLTIARMTDHNVRGLNDLSQEDALNGRVSEEEAVRIESYDLPDDKKEAS